MKAVHGFFVFTSYVYCATAQADDIRDVKSPVDIPGFPWSLVLVLLALGVLSVAAWQWWVRYGRAKMQPPVVIKTSWEIAYERLADLERRNLFGQGKVKEYFSALSDIIRRYIEDRFNIHAPEMTTEEFLDSVRKNPFIENRHKDTLKNFLVLSDMVKFAKYGANVAEAQESLGLARRFVDETKVEERTGEDSKVDSPTSKGNG